MRLIRIKAIGKQANEFLDIFKAPYTLISNILKPYIPNPELAIVMLIGEDILTHEDLHHVFVLS
jgi:hypothetical protein